MSELFRDFDTVPDITFKYNKMHFTFQTSRDTNMNKHHQDIDKITLLLRNVFWGDPVSGLSRKFLDSTIPPMSCRTKHPVSGLSRQFYS